MSAWLFVHGGGHGAWCWDKVVAILRERGHRAAAVDLPGHGAAAYERGAHADQGAAAAAVLAGLDEVGGPVMLVGHSLGGMTISAVGEARPEAIARLVYVSALLPSDGECAASLGSGFGPFGIERGTRMSADGEWTFIDAQLAPELFFSDCSDEDVSRACALIGPTSMGLVTSTVRLGDNFERLPKSYVACTEDRAISVKAQTAMVDRRGDVSATSFRASHSPFLSRPADLCSLLEALD